MGRLTFESIEKNTAEKKKRMKKVKIENDITNKVPEKTNSNSLCINKPLTRQVVRKAKVCMKQPVVRKKKYQKKCKLYCYCCFFGLMVDCHTRYNTSLVMIVIHSCFT